MDLNGKKILLVDDEPKITEVIKSYLENRGCIVFEAFDGNTALFLFDKHQPDFLIIDLMLPDISGEEICKAVRKKSNTPIIMLTAKVDEPSILNGLNLGADDYVTKPFSPRQLLARVEAVLRRSESASTKQNILTFNGGELVIDIDNYLVSKNNANLSLTPNEFKILSSLARYPKKVFSRDELINLVLGDDFEGFDRTIDTHVKNLRQKLENEPKSPKYIITVHGIGYRFGGE